MKRLLTLFLALVMIAGCLAGCGGEQSANNDQSGDANNPEAIDWPKKDIEIAALTLPAALPIPAPVLLVPSWVSIWV